MGEDGYDSCYRVTGVACSIRVGVFQDVGSGNAQVEGAACWSQDHSRAVYVIGPGRSVLGIALTGINCSRRWADEGHYWRFGIDRYFYRASGGRSFWWDYCDFWVASCENSRTGYRSSCGRSWLAGQSWDRYFRSASHWITRDHYVAARWIWRGVAVFFDPAVGGSV